MRGGSAGPSGCRDQVSSSVPPDMFDLSLPPLLRSSHASFPNAALLLLTTTNPLAAHMLNGGGGIPGTVVLRLFVSKTLFLDFPDSHHAGTRDVPANEKQEASRAECGFTYGPGVVTWWCSPPRRCATGHG